MKTATTCGSSCPPAGRESCRACPSAVPSPWTACPRCGGRGNDQEDGCTSGREHATQRDLAVKGVRVRTPWPALATARRKRTAERLSARERRRGRSYSRKDTVAPDGTLIPRPARDGRKKALDEARDRMRARDTARAEAVRHLVNPASVSATAYTSEGAGMPRSGMSYDWWRYD